jgi:hypothetical protein
MDNFREHLLILNEFTKDEYKKIYKKLEGKQDRASAALQRLQEKDPGNVDRRGRLLAKRARLTGLHNRIENYYERQYGHSILKK